MVPSDGPPGSLSSICRIYASTHPGFRQPRHNVGPEPIPFPTRSYSDSDRFELAGKGEAYLQWCSQNSQDPTPAA